MTQAATTFAVEIYAVQGNMITLGCSPPPLQCTAAFAGTLLLHSAVKTASSPRAKAALLSVLREQLATNATDISQVTQAAAEVVKRMATVHQTSSVSTILVELADQSLASYCIIGMQFHVKWDPSSARAVHNSTGSDHSHSPDDVLTSRRSARGARDTSGNSKVI